MGIQWLHGTDESRCVEKCNVPKTVTYIAPNAFANSGVSKLIVKNYYTEFGKEAYGYEEVAGPTSNGQYLDCKIVCYENSLAAVYARKNLIPVEIAEVDAVEVAIQSAPTKTEYEHGETLDTTGLSLTVTMSDRTTVVVTEGYEVSGFDSSTAGTKTITVTYKELTVEFSVYVKELTVTGITIEQNPTKLVYDIGESIDTTGLSLLATYSNGTTQSITSGFELDGYELNAAGEKRISVMYGGYRASFDVIVKQSGKVIVGNAKGRPGQEVEVTLSFEQAMSVKSMGISDLVYDESKLQLVSGTWNCDGLLADWNTEKEEGVLTFSKETEIEQFITLRFLVLEGVEDCNVSIECQVIATEQFDNKVESNINLSYKYGVITIYNVLPGDIDGNDILNSDDAVYLLYYTLMPEKYPANQGCDFNEDGMVNSDDAIYLLYHVMMPEWYLIN